MNKEFIPYEEALALKELGLDGLCFGDYFKLGDGAIIVDTDDDRDRIITDNPDEKIMQLKAPLYQQAFRWFREKYDLFGTVDKKDGIRFYKIEDGNEKLMGVSTSFNTYEEAELACLKKLIQLVKDKK